MAKNGKQDDWATLETFSWLQQAQLVKSFLENAGIESTIPEAHIGAISPMATAMSIHLLVKQANLEEAKKLLADFQVPEAPAPCSCGSTEWVASAAPARNWFRFIIGVLFMVPVRRKDKALVCAKCGAAG